jgi:hypothetical protein
VEWKCGEHRSKKTPPANLIALIEDSDIDVNRYIKCVLYVDAANIADAEKKAKKIKDKGGKDKKWKAK